MVEVVAMKGASGEEDTVEEAEDEGGEGLMVGKRVGAELGRAWCTHGIVCLIRWILPCDRPRYRRARGECYF